MAINNTAPRYESDVAGDGAALDLIGVALENRKQRRASRAGKTARRQVLANELDDLERRAEEVLQKIGAQVAAPSAGVDVAAYRSSLASLRSDIEVVVAGIAALDAQIRAEKLPLQHAETHAVRVEVRQTFGQALAQAAETRAHADRAGASHKSYVELVRKIVRLSRAIGEAPPLDLAGSHAALAGVGDGPDIWTVLGAHGIGRDFTAVGEQFAVLPCRTDDVAIDGGDEDDDDTEGVDITAENVPSGELMEPSR